MAGSGRVRIWAALMGLLAVGAGAAAWLLWPSPAGRVAMARPYLNASACLLTDPRGVVPGTPAAAVWAAMEKASLSTRVMVSYLSDTGPSDVTPMLGTLIQRQCGVIVGTGAVASQVIAAARAHPHQRFLLVTAADAVAASPPAPANAVVVSAADAAGRIDQAIRAVAAQA